MNKDIALINWVYLLVSLVITTVCYADENPSSPIISMKMSKTVTETTDRPSKNIGLYSKQQQETDSNSWLQYSQNQKLNQHWLPMDKFRSVEGVVPDSGWLLRDTDGRIVPVSGYQRSVSRSRQLTPVRSALVDVGIQSRSSDGIRLRNSSTSRPFDYQCYGRSVGRLFSGKYCVIALLCCFGGLSRQGDE